MFFCKVESKAAFATLRAGAGAAALAAWGETTSLLVGAADEELAVAAPVPNCPARKTCAALANFDLMSCAGASFDCSAAPAACGEAAADGLVAMAVGGALPEPVR